MYVDGCKTLARSAAQAKFFKQITKPLCTCANIKWQVVAQSGWTTDLKTAVPRKHTLFMHRKQSVIGFLNASFKKFWHHLPIAASFLASRQAPDGQKRQRWLLFNVKNMYS